MAQTLSLWSVFFFVKWWDLKDLYVLGHSQVTINWALEVKSLELNHWLVDTKRLMKEFNNLTFHHIYSELMFYPNPQTCFGFWVI